MPLQLFTIQSTRCAKSYRVLCRALYTVTSTDYSKRRRPTCSVVACSFTPLKIIRTPTFTLLQLEFAAIRLHSYILISSCSPKLSAHPLQVVEVCPSCSNLGIGVKLQTPRTKRGYIQYFSYGSLWWCHRSTGSIKMPHVVLSRRM